MWGGSLSGRLPTSQQTSNDTHAHGRRILVALTDLKLDALSLVQRAQARPLISGKWTKTSGPSC
jgi:hypothetical protein